MSLSLLSRGLAAEQIRCSERILGAIAFDFGALTLNYPHMQLECFKDLVEFSQCCEWPSLLLASVRSTKYLTKDLNQLFVSPVEDIFLVFPRRRVYSRRAARVSPRAGVLPFCGRSPPAETGPTAPNWHSRRRTFGGGWALGRWAGTGNNLR